MIAKNYTLRLTEEEHEFAKMIGDGSFGVGLRRCLAYFAELTPEPDLLEKVKKIEASRRK